MPPFSWQKGRHRFEKLGRFPALQDAPGAGKQSRSRDRKGKRVFLKLDPRKMSREEMFRAMKAVQEAAQAVEEGSEGNGRRKLP